MGPTVEWKGKTISGARREIRRLRALCEHQRNEMRYQELTLNGHKRDMLLLAMLAADEPLFDNPLRVYEVKTLRDRILADAGVETKGGS